MMLHVFWILLIVFNLIPTTMMPSTAIAQDRDAAEPRQIEWDLGQIYPSIDAWSAARAQLDAKVESLGDYRGRLGEDLSLIHI